MGNLKDWFWLKRIAMILTMKYSSRTLFTSYTDMNRIEDLKLSNSEVVYHSVIENCATI